MTRSNQILSAILLVQVGLIAWTRGSPDDGPTGQRGLLFAGLNPDAISGLKIESADASAEIARDGESWLVKGLDYAADKTKIEATLRELAGLQIADVVSTSRNFHKNLKVADGDFEKRVTLSTKDGEQSLLLGSSGRAGSTNVRKGGADTIYAVRDFSSWKVSERAESWLDKRVVDVVTEAISALTFTNEKGTVALSAQNDQWAITQGDGTIPANKTAVENLLSKLVGLRFDTLGTAGAASPQAVKVTIGLKAGGTVSLEAAPIADKVDRFLIHVEGKERPLELSKWSVQALLDASADSLTRQ